MSVKKLSLASLILLSLTACSSGGGKSGETNLKRQNELTQAQAELDSVKSELVKANQDLSSAQSELSKATHTVQQAQADLAKAQADKNTTAAQLAQAKANLANAEKAKEIAESKLSVANNEKQAVQNQLNSANGDLVKAKSDLQQAQADLAKAQVDKNTTAAQLAQAKANLANAEKAKEIAESKLSVANNEKQAVQNQLNSANGDLVKAKSDLQQAQADLAKAQADKNTTAAQLAVAEKAKSEAEMALQNKNKVIKEIVRKAAEITNEQGREYSWVSYTESSLPQGLSKHAFISMSAENLDGIFVGDHYIYLTPNVTLISRDHKAFWDSAEPKQSSFRVERINGKKTENLPLNGEATYIGKGFNSDNVGLLNYKVNFAEKTGVGSISQFNNASIPTIQLEKGNIVDGMIQANASAENGVTGKYALGFYGDNAQSIAGEAYLYKQFEGGITTDSRTAKKYSDSERGTVFGIAGERQ
ncbi:factor H binding protein domain-containing protein [Mannheimia pernigra]|uniref:factor H binding protein domain-containing protein n=1 Tax=Mannheimia pernigra TaxID=111844 RepID=UPI001319B45E|nr:factor H binding protein domain-containing protein [Mannheimia pernigra]QHB16936.1 hypothetical protein GM695_02155 [Mannheimia pernigra]